MFIDRLQPSQQMTANSPTEKDPSPLKCCWVGGARYSYPLDKTSAKKFGALKTLGELFVIGFSTHFRPRRVTQHARFFLLPKSQFPALRYLTFFLLSPIVMLWLVKRYGVNILIAQSPYEGFAAAWARIIARILFRKNIALIVESHGDFERRKNILSAVYQPIVNKITHFALSRADVLRAVSNATRKQLEIHSPGIPIVQFPAWTDIETFLKAGAHKNTSSSAQTILFVGNLVPVKGAHVLTESFALIAEDFRAVKLILIGKSQDQRYARTLLKSMPARLKERVTFLGHLPQSRVAHHMANASVLVAPSLSEGLGRVIFEAMACGIPVIGSNIGGIPELITDEVTGFLVPPRDESALASKISWILNNPIKTREMGLRAREFAENFFSSQTYVQEYLQLFELARLKENLS